MKYYLLVLERYATFTGRARRSEYWYFSLFNLFIAFAVGFICGMLRIPEFANIYTFGVLLPSIAVGVRRMHDIGRNGWYLLIPIYNIVLLATPGIIGDNEYGSDPKAFLEEEDIE